MTIEFRCPTCAKKLRTGDDKAGQTAECPQCGSSIAIPAVSVLTEEDLLPVQTLDPPASFEASRAAGQIICPMCGAANDSAATRCYACGEDLFGRAVIGRIPSRQFGDIWRAAWDAWMANFGINIAAALIAAVFWVVGYMAFIALMMLFFVGFSAAFGNGGDADVFIVLTAVIAGYLVFFVLYSLLLTGFSALAIDQMRMREVGLGAMFRVFGTLGPGLVGTFVSSFGLTVAMLPGIGLYVGGIIAAEHENMIGGPLALIGYIVMFLGWGVGWTFFWPIHYIIVDRPGAWFAPAADGVRMAAANFRLSLLMSITHAGLLAAGFLTCYLGLLFVMPLSFLLFAVAYDRCDRSARTNTTAGNADTIVE